MASSPEIGSYGESLICPLCLGLFVDPVLVDCDRNFCCSCILYYRKDQGGTLCCPQCGEHATDLTLQPNRVLRNVVDKIRRLTGPQEGKEGEERLLCPEHQEKLSLVCETDGMFICLVCRDSKLHQQHKFRERTEFVTTCKNQGIALLNSLKQKVVSLKDALQKQGLQSAETKELGCSLICHIAQQFAHLHQFLNEREQRLIKELEVEVESSLAEMDGNLSKLRGMLFSTELNITNMEAKLERGDLASLKEVSSWKDRFSEEPPTVVPGNICLGTYRGPLQYKLWREMKAALHPVPTALTLDPQTANPWLRLSEDLTTVTAIETKQLIPDNPARFDVCVSLLAAEGFTAGVHYWEVEVSAKSKWDLGVARESINRKGDIALKPENGYLALSLSNGEQYCALTSPAVTTLTLGEKPSRIGIYLDYEGGQVSFYNAADLSHLYTFTETFAERIFPYFCPCLNDTGDNGGPLTVVSLRL
ncbi:zinc-binding protein A33-like [Scyliorhinus canicula]|uniref:zinc-binding protein A33-like n=1 Tax=Scyliorhinus canicula TaxID=7830 RepID=UPI0018F4C223|nr:zinc-binding protein A33-like [Scyliorhinus canicula]